MDWYEIGNRVAISRLQINLRFDIPAQGRVVLKKYIKALYKMRKAEDPNNAKGLKDGRNTRSNNAASNIVAYSVEKCKNIMFP